MADKISEDQVADLIAILRKDVSVDAKVQQVTAAKSSIKQNNVPDSCVAPLFEALRAASTAQHAVLVNAGFTGLNHLLTRLSRQEPKYLVKEATRTLPLIVEKLGDQKEKFRSIASQALVTMWTAAPMEVERSVRNTAMVGKNPRAKEASMHWLLQMHQENGLQFRSYVPVLMELLEDADGMVRDAAKTTVIELFRNAPNAAKSDLKKQLKNFKVRPAIEQAIVKELAPTTLSAAPSDLEPPRPDSALSARSTRPNLGASVSSLSAERPITPLLPDRPEQVEPTYVNTQRELDEIFRDMHFHFEGRETEQNWLKREESMTKLRRLLAGNAATDFQDHFISGVRGLLDGIIKAVSSLRTSLSKEGCSLVQELAVVYGPGMDPMVELLMQTFIKLCAATKKISSQLANVTVDTIIGRVTYNARIMQHVWGACQDKNVQPRLYASGWVTTILKKEAHHKSHVEHTGGLEVIEKCLKKGLLDANPGVREKMRATYWTFAGIWPARAEAIMAGLDGTAQKLLQKDPHNPNSPQHADGGARPGLGLSKSTMGTLSKPSIREAMLAQKRALASKNLPARPGSAMAHFSPVRTVSGSSSATTSSGAAAKPPVRQRQELTHGTGAGTGQSSLSAAPMRPARRRPDLAQRPATAGPYSVRTHDAPSAEQSSPPDTRMRQNNAVTPKSITASPRRTAPRTRPGHAATASESSVPSPSRLMATSHTSKVPVTAAATGKTSATSSPRGSPAKPKPAPALGHPSRSFHAASSSPSRAHEDLTMVVPHPSFVRAATTAAGSSPQTIRSANTTPRAAAAPAIAVAPEAGMSEDPAAAPAVGEENTPVSTHSRGLKVYEDPFTTEDQTTPRPVFTRPVLEDRPVNEDAANLNRSVAVDVESATADGSILGVGVGGGAALPSSPDKTKQNSRLLDSGISKVKAKTLDVHGFRKLQAIVRDGKAALPDDKFDALLTGLFEFLQSPLAGLLAPEKVPDVKAQVLATIRLLLRRSRDGFRPHVSRALESLLEARCAYGSRTHIVSGMELLADELVALGDASEITLVLTRTMRATEMDVRGCRALSMGLHVLAQMIDAHSGSGGGGAEGPSSSPSSSAGVGVGDLFQPSEAEMDMLSDLAGRCLESAESAVRMDAVLLCVALHARVGDQRFWGALRGVKDDPKSLITYYIVKRQREREREAAAGGGGAAAAAAVAAA